MLGIRHILTMVLIVVLGAYLFLALGPDEDALRYGNDQLPTAEDVSQSDTKRLVDSNERFETGQTSDVALPPSVIANWRTRPETALHWKKYQSIAYLDLRSLAESGDGRAAAWLAALLVQCRSFPMSQTDAEIEAEIEEMRRTHLVPRYSRGFETMQDFNNHLDSLDANIEVYEKRARTCSNVPAEHRLEWEDWAHRALATGHTDDLTHTLLADSMEHDDYMQLLTDLWSSGEPTALLSLAARNMLGYHQGTNPYGQIRQYAYQYAALTLLHDFHDELGTSSNASWISQTLSDELQHLRRQMRPNEIRQAEDLAASLIEKNQNCCLIWPDHFLANE